MRFPREGGILPDSLFLPKFNLVNVFSKPSEFGNTPSRLLLLRFSQVISPSMLQEIPWYSHIGDEGFCQFSWFLQLGPEVCMYRSWRIGRTFVSVNDDDDDDDDNDDDDNDDGGRLDDNGGGYEDTDNDDDDDESIAFPNSVIIISKIMMRKRGMGL